MHLKLLRVAASAALCGGIVTLGLIPTQAALATTPTYINVPCSTDALVADMTAPANDTVLNLAWNCTYELTSGLPDVTNTLTINGHFNTSIERSYADGTDSFSIFVVDCCYESDGILALNGVNVRNGGGTGTDDGGAIYNDGTVTIHRGTFSDNNTAYYGGAIANFGTLTANGAMFTRNSSGWGGAIYTEPDGTTLNWDTFSHNSAYDDGGAVYNDDHMTISNSFFKYNHADDEGGAVYNDYNLTIVHSQFGMNTAAYGGAIDNQYNLEVDTSLIATNFAKYNGGGIYNDDDDSVTLVADLINLNLPNQCYPVGTIAGCFG